MARALVTGATSGIGRAIAVALRHAGHEVFAIGRRPDALEALARDHAIRPIRADVTDGEALARALDGVELDILVNNAGIVPPLANFCDMAEADIQRALAVNLSAPLMLTRLVATGMRQRRGGHIFFTGSTAGHAPFVNYAVYGATKAAIAGFAQALRLELGPYGVRVTEIVAGRVETELYKDVLPEEARAAMYAGHSAVQAKDVATMVLAAIDLPASVNLARFDILPTHQAAAAAPRKES